MNQNALGAALQTIALLPMQDIAATADGTGVSVVDFVGSVAFTLSGKNVAGTNPTMIVKLQHSDDDSDYTDISGAVFTTITAAGTKAATLEKIYVNVDGCKKYIRAVKTIGGTDSPQFLLSLTGLGLKQVR